MEKYNNIPVFKFMQNNQPYYSAILPHELIDMFSEVLIYGKSPNGYQREPIPSHINKIKNYILSSDEARLPTAVVLAIDEDDVNKVFIESVNNITLNLNIKPLKIFRIVDGQHRIYAMSEAIKINPNLKDFLFNVIVLVTKSRKRSIEMEVFYDINSKSKRLKVDLIELARFNYRILENEFKMSEINEHVSIQTANYLNEKIENCVWSNAIKFGIHDDRQIGVIGVNAFRESIAKVVDAFLNINDKSIYKSLVGDELVIYIQETSMTIAEFVHSAWDEVVRNKWQYCFKEGATEYDLFYDPQKIYYHQKYYIQRTMGTKVLNSILGECVESNGLNKESLDTFIEIINRSNITSDDWQVGGTFGGYSSESGFKKMIDIIKNNQPIKKSYI